MSGSDSSNTWSGSVDSYFSESSSSWQCSAPRRLVTLVTEQLRRLKCRNNKRNEEGEGAMFVTQDPSIKPRQLAGLLKERLELLNAESDEDDQHVTRSPRKVVFLEDKPSCSGTDSSQLADIMEVDVTLSSKAILQVPLTSADAVLGDPKECDLGKIMLGGQTSIFRVNFPDLEELENSVTKADVSVIEENEHEGDAVRKKMQIRTMSGEVRVYENGRIAIAYGGKVYEMTMSASPAFDQELIRVDQVEGLQSGIMTSLGPVQHYVDLLPRTEEDICACTTVADEEKSKGEDRQDEEAEGIHREEF